MHVSTTRRASSDESTLRFTALPSKFDECSGRIDHWCCCHRTKDHRVGISLLAWRKSIPDAIWRVSIPMFPPMFLGLRSSGYSAMRRHAAATTVATTSSSLWGQGRNQLVVHTRPGHLDVKRLATRSSRSLRSEGVRPGHLRVESGRGHVPDQQWRRDRRSPSGPARCAAP